MRCGLIVVSALVAVALVASAASVVGEEELSPNVKILTPDNFDDFVGADGKHVLVAFTAPWCGHCKSLKPEYSLFADTFSSETSVVVANVDADKHRDLGTKFGVSGFPTIKYFPPGSQEGVAYSDGRSADDFVKFMNEKAGTNLRVKKAPTAVVILNDQNFDSIALDPKKNVLVEFYAPWCGHCKQLAPTYEKVARAFAGEPNVVIANFDATESKVIAEKYEVKGYPTLKWFPADDKTGIEYSSGRGGEDFVKFINDKVGTERILGGGFLPTVRSPAHDVVHRLTPVLQAGRIKELDDLVIEFLGAPEKKRKAIISEAKGIVESTSDHKYASVAKFYALGMNKYIKVGADYAEQEKARLQRMIDSVKPEKKAEFYLRINILDAFKQA